MKKRADDYLITEPPLPSIVRLALPLMLGSLFQQFYTMADSVIVGRFVGEGALAAVGASSALTSVFIAAAIGGGSGATVVTSREFGARLYSRMKESISTAVISFALASIILASIGYALSPSILSLLKTPGDIMEEAVSYLQIYFLGLPFLFIYNIFSSVFTSLGKSSIPLCLLVFSSLLNVGLDIIAVAGLGMGIEGAAWATLVSQAISALLSFIILIKVLNKLQGRAERYFSASLLKEMTAIAIPSIIQQSTIAAGMMLVQSVVNTFGTAVLAGYSAAIRVDNIATVPLSATGNAISPYTAQNAGAGKKERIRSGYKAALLLIIISGALICLLLLPGSNIIAAVFLGEEGTAEAYRTCENYLSFLCFFYSILGFAMVTGGVLRGLGEMRFFTLASIANLSFRVIGSMLLAPRFGVAVVWYVVPIGWSIYFLMTYSAYKNKQL